MVALLQACIGPLGQGWLKYWPLVSDRLIEKLVSLLFPDSLRVQVLFRFCFIRAEKSPSSPRSEHAIGTVRY